MKKAGMIRLVVPLRLFLYSHPMSGKYWENHFTEKVLSVGFEKMMGWECLFVHKKLSLILSVYVDDFKLVGKSENLKKGWQCLKDAGLLLDNPTPLGDYLGCGQFPLHVPPEEAQRRLEQAYPLVEGHKDEDSKGLRRPRRPAKAAMTCSASTSSAWTCTAIELANVEKSSVKKVATPSLDDHAIKPEEFELPGRLQKEAARIVMKMLYGARLVRYDLLWPICSIAREVSRWNVACGRRLRRLICYLHHTWNHSLESFVGDTADQCHVLLFTDADFAGDVRTSKSTSGSYIAIVGPNAFGPIAALCKKQTCVPQSSNESEIVAAEYAVRTEGLRIFTFWEHVTHIFGAQTANNTTTSTKGTGKSLGDVVVDGLDQNFNPVKYFNQTRPEHPQTKLIVAEDYEAVIKIISKSRSTALRHLPRTHCIDVNWLFEVCDTPGVIVRYTNTKQQIADLLTKAMTKPDVWNYLIDLAQIRQGPVPEGQRQAALSTTKRLGSLPE